MKSIYIKKNKEYNIFWKKRKAYESAVSKKSKTFIFTLAKASYLNFCISRILEFKTVHTFLLFLVNSEHYCSIGFRILELLDVMWWTCLEQIMNQTVMLYILNIFFNYFGKA